MALSSSLEFDHSCGERGSDLAHLAACASAPAFADPDERTPRCSRLPHPDQAGAKLTASTRFAEAAWLVHTC
eukprot:1823914-Pleurochrysis_carterae.AAC.1